MTTNLVDIINSFLKHTKHLPISSVFSTTFYRLATLMPRMELKHVKQMKARHMYVKEVRTVMVVNTGKARSMYVELYSRQFETFYVAEPVGHRPGTLPRSNRVDL
ncbi:hypothetical protein GOBAR_DD25961 [Gossypium barbadense]|nr:hypothetical protein GOBAR_DD25961 [Gossypium barbadense]